jgi:hypothetical protein
MKPIAIFQQRAAPRMRAPSRPGAASDARHDESPSEASVVDHSRTILQIAINIVFGMPFLWCLLGAVRGPIWWGSHRLLGDGIGRDSAFVWAAVAALGALWLGVSLMVAPARGRRTVGVLLVLTGSALLVGFHP